MYWWNVSKLAEDFREGRVEEKERFKYFLATSILWALGSRLPYYGQTFKIMDLISAAVFVSGTIAGTILCYRANRKGDNADFIGRMICLNWPIFINVAVLFSTIGLVVMVFVFFPITEALGLEPDAVGTFFVGLFGIFYYWLIHKYIGIVAHPKAPAAPRLTSPVESLEV